MAGRWDRCLTCDEGIWLTPEREELLRRTCQTFYCLWGHSQHFTRGPSENDKLRLERDRLKQEAARLEERAQAYQRAEEAAQEHAAYQARRAAAARGQVTRLKNRAAAGLCPCCNRSFSNLQRHMAGQHPGFQAE